MPQIQETDEFLELKLNFAIHVIQKLEEIEQLILNLENEKDEAELKNISRQLLAEFHSIKGSSGALIFESIKIICHKVEDIVLTEGIIGLNDKIELLLIYKDAIKNYFDLFIKDKKVDELVFLKKYNSIFENMVHQKNHSDNSKIQKISLNILIVGLPTLLIKNFVKSATDFDLCLSYASSSVNALERLSKEKFHLVLSSYFIEPLNGLSLCAAVKLQWPNNELKFILFPSQEVELTPGEDFKKISPDKIILKNQSMYTEFTDYLLATFKKNRLIKKIVFLDDDINILDLYKITFEDFIDIEMLYIIPDKNIRDVLINLKPDLVFSDINMPNVDVQNLLEYFANKGKEQPDFIFVSGDVSKEKSKQLLDLSAKAVFEKAIITTSLIEQCENLGYQLRKRN